MKALTISQPYASLIADGESVKPAENRSWYTSYRGLLAIHAGKGTQYLTRKKLLDVPHGVVIATCRMIACGHICEWVVAGAKERVPSELEEEGWKLGRFERLLRNENTEGPYLFVFADMEKLSTPIPAVGKQGLWDFEYPKVKP